MTARTRRNPSRTAWQQEHHGDLGALRERVSGTERSIDQFGEQLSSNQRDTARQIESLQRDTANQISNLQASLSSQIRDISTSFSASRSTNWGTIVAAASFIVLLGGAVLAPIMGDIYKIDATLAKAVDKMVNKDIYQHGQDDQNNWLANLRDRTRDDEKIITEDRITLAKLEGATAERHETYVRDHAVLLARVDAIDGSLIKRPEIESALASNKDVTTLTNAATTARIDALANSLNDLRREVGSSYTWGDGLKHALDRIDSIQQEINAITQAVGRVSGLQHDGAIPSAH